jgi:hypothetical protein
MVVWLSALRASRLPFTPRKIPGTHFLQGHGATGRVNQLKNSNVETDLKE